MELLNKRNVALLSIIITAGCSSPRDSTILYDPRTLPRGPVGASIAYGHRLIIDTPALVKSYVRANLSCQDCHVEAGTRPRAGTFVGVYGRFPQWNRRAHRVIALQDRIAECFLYSMNGRPPAYSSPAMIAIVSYISWLSRGTPVAAQQHAGEGYIEPLPRRAPDANHGARLFGARCVHCHQASGQGVSGTYPPLWGRLSFNDKAGMAHLDRMTGFVYHNMPQNAPGSLSLDEAYDIAAYVLHQPRPHFRGNVTITSRALPAKYF